LVKKPYKVWKELELGLGGGSKFRILVYLISNPNEAFTKYALTKASGLRAPTVENYLKTLLELNWVEENSFTPKTYQINLKNALVNTLFQSFQKIKYEKRK
jgi:DNA-binding IclR family transcriptional regulator